MELYLFETSQGRVILWYLFTSWVLNTWILSRYLSRDGYDNALTSMVFPKRALREKSFKWGIIAGMWIWVVMSPLTLVMTFLVWVFYYGTGVSIGLYSIDVFGSIPKPMIIVSFFLGFTIIAAFLTDYVQRIDRFIQTYGMFDELDKIFTSNEEE
ncbi:MAG: hypothetical protein ACPHUK_06720 [Candidatus Poseidoniaceae archaeon]